MPPDLLMITQVPPSHHSTVGGFREEPEQAAGAGAGSFARTSPGREHGRSVRPPDGPQSPRSGPGPASPGLPPAGGGPDEARSADARRPGRRARPEGRTGPPPAVPDSPPRDPDPARLAVRPRTVSGPPLIRPGRAGFQHPPSSRPQPGPSTRIGSFRNRDRDRGGPPVSSTTSPASLGSFLRVCPESRGGLVGWVKPTDCDGLPSVGFNPPTTVEPTFRDGVLPARDDRMTQSHKWPKSA